MIHPDALALIKKMETFMPEAYQDGARLAQGYGHSVGEPTPSKSVVWSEEYASQVLEADCEIVAEQIRRTLQIELTDRQFGALVSFVFNRGIGSFKKTKVLEFINSPTIAYHLVKAGCSFTDEENCKHQGKVMWGLRRRRILEAAMFMSEL